MIFTILVISYLLCFINGVKLSLTIYTYLIKKPFGLQSVLDLLILDMIKVTLFLRTFFILCFLLPGCFYGRLDYFTSQLIIFILINVRVFFHAQLQYYLVIKAILIFKGHWLNCIMDNQIVCASRIVAFSVTCVRFIGDFLVIEKQKQPGPMTTFLTGADEIR